MPPFALAVQEVIRHEPYSKAADVYSFAMVLFELITRQLPFADLTPVQAAAASGLNGHRPSLPAGLPEAMGRLITGCWTVDVASRPCFEEIHQSLGGMNSYLGLSAAECKWLDEPKGHPVYVPTRERRLFTYAHERPEIPILSAHKISESFKGNARERRASRASGDSFKGSDRERRAARMSGEYEDTYNKYIC